MKLTDFNRVHLIGVGGIGMSALARLFLHEGKQVSGSDREGSRITKDLENLGLDFNDAQVADNITNTLDLVVYTEAMSKDHEEMVAAKEAGVPMMNYFDALGMVANEYYLVAVAGSHGKTTTTAMLIDIFEDAGLDPTAIVGSLRAETGSNFRAGKSKYCIVEACEYKRDFLSLEPDILVVTNIEHEHVDYFTSFEDVQSAFAEFAMRVREGGFVVANTSDVSVRPIVEGLKDQPITVVNYKDHFNPTRVLTMPGIHNQLNAAAAVAAAVQVGVPIRTAEQSLAAFKGVWRRFEYKGEVNGAKIYDDYGHHPTEICATIQGARELYPDKEITVVFQSHTYTRTHALFNDFVEALALADKVIVLPIYAAREENVSGVSHAKLADAINEKHNKADAHDVFDVVVETLKSTITENDVVLVMGAGDVTDVATKLVS